MAGAPVFQFAYTRSPDQSRASDTPAHHPVIIVGAGPVGLTLALDLARRGVKAVVLDDADRIGEGSRAICFAKRTLEIFDRLGVATCMVEKGVGWQRGRVFQGERELYAFDLLPEPGHKMPAFINLQQYYVEKHLVDAVLARTEVDLRWRNRVTAIERRADGANVTIETPDGPYALTCEWLVACDGARSPCRSMLGLSFEGEVFADQFLIADVKMTAAFPTERWFWFDPPFHSGRSALLHKQPDDIWRIDLQLSPEADTEAERRPERVRERIVRMLGHGNFELEWVSIYRFQCRRLRRFVHDRIVFAGDAAHQVSPFGARGANSGIQDSDNLGWKLAAVLQGDAPERLIESYHRERSEAADENILNSTRATDFIAPRSPAEALFRDAALALAAEAPFAKRFVNSGRLSTPTAYGGIRPPAEGGIAVGAPLPDAPLTTPTGAPVWLLEALGIGFTAIHVGQSAPDDGAAATSITLGRDLIDAAGIAADRLTGGRPGTVVVRPDGHVAARLASASAAEISEAVRRTLDPAAH
jgi:3-(3-hydroxy-phenyl)propionate hydroxylase